ncbi:MAG TPA: twin-arginine translocase TatA/TatE family subunit [Kiritimatiellia bacterium]|nr:twin-arginine translocase TatA/TatE family subunit [Kiritimatiellia bacterium]HRU71188.1 twin-arginine translocase TatA/TatE family subunit [Kiritimatiellia bacterium]
MSYFPCLAFLGGSVGAGEWVVLFAVVLIVVGPKRLPEIARKVGRMMEMFRRAADEFRDQLMNMDQPAPPSSPDTSYGGGDTPPDHAEPYDNPYPDIADYPGNEDQVAEWSSGSSEAPADSQGATEAEKPTAPEAPETPVERAP